jgi:flagellar protein FlgJ
MDAAAFPNASSLDPTALGALRGKARAQDPKALEAAAKQFESLFLNQLLKSMRDASQAAQPEGGGLFDSNENRIYTGLLAEQMANKLANGRGIGLADMIIAQVDRARNLVAPADAIKSLPAASITKAGA